jgi:phosphoribosylformimino-5-aminoimidazole carboxamide ribotide isomerase
MRLIPVIDLMNGQTVHAVRGDRQNYKPVQSVICDTPDPIMVARVFRDRLDLSEIYIADLNAIQNSGRTNHRDLIAALAGSEQMAIILDAGISDPETARAWLRLGVGKTVIGSETLRELHAVQQLPAQIDPDRLIFSLDMRAGRVLSQCAALSAMSPIDILHHLQSAGWKEVILLDLSRVGSGKGMDPTLAIEARSRFPDLNLLIGGGIADPNQLLELKSMGIVGVLVATALHRGIITTQHISALR